MPTCNDNNNIKICLRLFHGEAMAQWDNHALPEGSRFESGWANIDLLPQCFSSSCRNSLLAFKSSSQILHQSFHAQTVLLLTPSFGPPEISTEERSDCLSFYHDHVLLQVAFMFSKKAPDFVFRFYALNYMKFRLPPIRHI